MPLRSRLTRLLRLSADVSGDLDLASVAWRVAETVPAVTDFEIATVTLRKGDRCRRLAAVGLDHPEIGLETSYQDWRPLVRERSRVGSLSYRVEQGQDRLVLALQDPDGEIIGFLSVEAPRSGGPPDRQTFEVLELLAHQAQAVLVNARLYDVAERHRQSAETLREVIEAVSSSLDLQEVIERCCDAVVAHSVGERATVLLHEPDQAVFVPMVSRATAEAQQHGHPFTDPEAIPEAHLPTLHGALEANRSVFQEQVDRAELAPAERRLYAQLAAASIAAYPLTAGERKVGLLIVDAPSAVRFPDDERGLIRQIARHAAMAIGQARLHERAREAAERDSLTGLKNRRVFWLELAQELATASAEKPLALAVLDVDDYKRVNDEYGHATGDLVLHHVADRLSRSVRQTDTAYRVGGDEFTLVMPETSAEEAREVTRRAAGRIKRSRLPVPVPSLSWGIAVAPAEGRDRDTLFNAADAAMYTTKRRRRARRAGSREGTAGTG